MKAHLILRDFTGSQNGIDSESFAAGTTRDLSDSLVAALGGPAGGYVKPADVAAAEIAVAPPALADAVLEGIAEAEGEGETPGEDNSADLRETKVVEPEETKPGKPFVKKGKK